MQIEGVNTLLNIAFMFAGYINHSFHHHLKSLLQLINTLDISIGNIYDDSVNWMLTTAIANLPNTRMQLRNECVQLSDNIMAIIQYINATESSNECVWVSHDIGREYIQHLYYAMAETLHIEATYTMPTRITGNRERGVFAMLQTRPDSAGTSTSYIVQILISVYKHTNFTCMTRHTYTEYIAALLNIYAYTKSTDISQDHIQPALDMLQNLTANGGADNTDDWCDRARNILLLVLENVISVSFADKHMQCA